MTASASHMVEAYLRFRAQGMRKGSSYLFAPEAALSLVDALAALGVAPLGVTGWYRPAGHPEWLAEDTGADYGVPEALLKADKGVERSAEAVKAFIRARLLETHPYVEVRFDHPYAWFDELDRAWKAAEATG